MELKDVQSKIQSIILSKNIPGLKVFAYVKSNEELQLKKLLTDDKLNRKILQMLVPIVEKLFLDDSLELDSCDNIADKRKILYEFNQTEKFYPFNLPENLNEITGVFSQEMVENIKGLFFRFNMNDDAIWFYQHIYHVRLVKKSKSIFALMTHNNIFTPFNKDFFNIDSRIDLLIINNRIITQNVDLLQREFGFDAYIRSEAEATINLIDSIGILSDISKLFSFEDKEKLTNAKKLLRAKNSPVLTMKKDALINGLKNHRRYKNIFEFKDDKIVVNSQKMVNEFVKMLNDDIVRSELTNTDYDSASKAQLDPI